MCKIAQIDNETLNLHQWLYNIQLSSFVFRCLCFCVCIFLPLKIIKNISSTLYKNKMLHRHTNIDYQTETAQTTVLSIAG